MSNEKTASSPPHRLIGIHCRADYRLPPPLHTVDKIDVDLPGVMLGWGVHIRGATMFLVSPPGWKQGRDGGKHRVQWDANGVRHVYGPIALANVTLVWEQTGAENTGKVIDGLQRYDLPEIKGAARAAPDTGPAIPPSQMGDP